MNGCVSVYGVQFSFVVNYVVVGVGSMTCCYTGYLILNYLKVIEVSGRDDWGPCVTRIFDYGSSYGFVGVNECFFALTP